MLENIPEKKGLNGQSKIYQQMKGIKPIKMKKLILFIVVAIWSCQSNSFENDTDAFFSKAFPNQDEPGAAVLVMKGDQIIFSKGYGVADIQTEEKITSTTRFNLGSISKTFVAYTILSLEAEGKLSLDDSLSKYFPDFKNKSIADRVTVRHLLTHTSGLPDNRRQFLDSVILLTAKDKENFDPIKQNDSLLFEPGSRYEYSNPAFNGLALIIENVTGRKWQEAVKEKILSRSDMPHTVITDGPFPESGVSHSYLKTSNGFVEKDYGEEPTFPAAGNGGVWSSTDELAKYELAIRKAAFLNAEVINKSRTVCEYPNWKSEIKPFIGLCWFVGETNGLKMISHTGTQGGFYCDFVSIPEKGITYVMLCNVPTPQEEKRAAVLALLKKYNWLD
jgi:CubicO group peptidase (beta-lactamase class C family)